MARWQVNANGWEQQGWLSFSEAARRAAEAHHHGHPWDARVHDGVSWRLLNETEAAKLVAAITEELR